MESVPSIYFVLIVSRKNEKQEKENWQKIGREAEEILMNSRLTLREKF